MLELKEFGLTDNEVSIYLSLLKLGTITPSKIAKFTGFSRSYVYDALNRLLDKEIVSSILINNKKHFTAIDPKRLGQLAKQRFEKIQNIIPKLSALQKLSKSEINVELHKGKYVYKILLRDILLTLKKDQEVLIFGIDDDVLIKLDKYYLTHLKQYFARLNNLNIKEKVIVKAKSKLLKQAKTTSYRFLPKNVIGNTAFEVYGSKVAIFLLGNPNHLILIDNKQVADSYRNQFKILWDNSNVSY